MFCLFYSVYSCRPYSYFILLLHRQRTRNIKSPAMVLLFYRVIIDNNKVANIIN